MNEDIEQGIVLSTQQNKFIVKVNDRKIAVTAKGNFFKKEQSILAGDRVNVLLSDEGGMITEVFERKNSLTRPKISNLDTLFIVISICEPAPSLLVIDKLITICCNKNINPILIVTKMDLKNGDEIINIYKNAGFTVLVFDYNHPENNVFIREKIKDGIFAFCGNTGVGKSTILNALFDDLQLETNEISKKLGRGKHTTRLVSLIEIDDNTFVADTPGFGAVDMIAYDISDKQSLQFYFPEFDEYINTCKFVGCSHTCELGCNILKAVDENKIQKSRHDNYKVIYEELSSNRINKNE